MEITSENGIPVGNLIAIILTIIFIIYFLEFKWYHNSNKK